MKRKLLSTSVLMVISASMTLANAQFNTVVDKRNMLYEIIPNRSVTTHIAEIKPDTLDNKTPESSDIFHVFSLPCPTIISSKEPLRKKHLDLFKSYEGLPSLTISNLLYEIRRNGIQHEKVVLAQAILETGWFTSSVCRNKNNLFGLTNPRTGQYYEFNHWTESVRAYYTKVQNRYKGGNYLLWLDEIGYAEKKTYVQALIELLNQYFL